MEINKIFIFLALYVVNMEHFYEDTLNGFYTYANELEKVKKYFSENSQYIIFGEWMQRKRSNSILHML